MRIQETSDQLSNHQINDSIEFIMDTAIDENLFFSKLEFFDCLENSRRINLFATLAFMTVGMVGHAATVFVFAQKRFRKNSSNVYLLCLAVNDAFFLIVHFFEVCYFSFEYFKFLKFLTYIRF